MQTDMIRWFDEMWRESAHAWHPLQRFGSMSAAPLFGLPPADFKQTDGAYALTVELPGIKREDLDLAIDGDILRIGGHKQEDRHEAGTAWRLSERRYGRFERSFPLPPDARADRIAASFEDGVLTITLPRDGDTRAGKREQVDIRS
jgi:HSP20 family protein